MQEALHTLLVTLVQCSMPLDGDTAPPTMLEVLAAVASVEEGVAVDACETGLPMALAALATLPPSALQDVLVTAAHMPHAGLLWHALQLAGVLGAAPGAIAVDDGHAACCRAVLLLMRQVTALGDACQPLPAWPGLVLQRASALATV